MIATPSDANEPEDPERRFADRAGRTNLLLSASIVAGDISGPVRIRNLSETGAMLEGASLPKVGRRLTLRRQELEMGAIVVWLDGSRCGVRFDGKVSVDGWTTGTWVAPSGARDQSKVDAIQSAVRLGADVSPVEADGDASDVVDGNAIAQHMAEELNYLARLLADMGEQLSEEPTLIRKYPQMLQNFDRASQILEHLARVTTASDPVTAAKAIGMEDLKGRLLRKRLFR